MATRIQHRRGTAAEWATVNPVLAAGEPGSATDTGQEKIGDGNTPWNQLRSSGYVVDQSVGRVIKVWDYLNGREQMIYGDTGERDITALLTPAAVSGKIILSRTGNTVQLELQELVLQAAAASYVQYPRLLPVGFCPNSSYIWFNTVSRTSSEDVSAARVSKYGELTVYGLKENEIQYGLFSWLTPEPWPTTELGVAVVDIPA